MYEDEFELTFDTPEEEPVYEPEKASAAPAPVPETTPAEIVPDEPTRVLEPHRACLLYTSDAADEEDSVDLGGPRILNKKKKKKLLPLTILTLDTQNVVEDNHTT